MDARLKELLDRMVGVPRDNTSASEKHEVHDYVHAMDRRIEKALDLARRYSQIDGSHHKAWTLDQMVRALTGDESKEGDTYGWDVGIAP